VYPIQEIDSATLAQWLGDSRDVLLIDVRTPGEIYRGIIPTGKALPLNQLPYQADTLPRNGPVVFYCRTGARSAQACAFMMARGYQEVYNLRGGIMDWARHGQEITAATEDTFRSGAGGAHAPVPGVG
jgi:rhodanese-related sulfurtransferase